MEQIDARGKACPTPVILAKNMADLGNETFTVLVDNKAAVENLKRFSNSAGYDAIVNEIDSDWSVMLRRSGASPIVSEKDSTKSWAVFIGKAGIGDGDPELGAFILKMFFYTLTQGDDLPSFILMMNGGVKVAVEHEETIEHLKELESRGTKILVCGACLNFFNMAENLSAGIVSNMYDILHAMRSVDQVISL